MERFQVNNEEVSLCKELIRDRSQHPKEQKDNIFLLLLLVGILNVIGRQLGKTRLLCKAEGVMQDAVMVARKCQQPLQVLA